jgi:hypothetical protein
MSRSANRHEQKSGKSERKDAVRGLRRSLDAACDLFLIRRGLKGQGSFRFGGKR